MTDGLKRGDDGITRCFWAGSDSLYVRYHDAEWGRPTYDDARLFEKICLEGFQSGLSWLTILKKREGFRAAFAGFDPGLVARFDEADVARLLADASIVRHRGKIVSTVNNARRALALIERHGSLANYFWRFVPPAGERPRAMVYAELSKLSQTPTSTAMSKDLKSNGFSFVGPTTCYAFMQAMGLVNDHLDGCASRAAVPAPR